MPNASPHHNQRLELRYVPIDAVKPCARQLRVYSRAERQRIVKAIVTFGPMAICAADNLVNLSGDVWIDCMKTAGVTEVPVIVMRHLTPALADAFMVSQVGLIERGAWDERELGRLFLDLTMSATDLDLSITGFDLPQIDLLLENLSIEVGEDGATTEAPIAGADGPTATRAGDLWLLGAHRVLCGDARDRNAVERLMGDVLAQMAIADLPYNVRIDGHVSGLGQTRHREFACASGEMTKEEFIAFLTNSVRRMAERCEDGALVYLFMDWRHIAELLAAADAVGLTLVNLCIWAKPNGGMGSFYRSQHELIFVFRKGEASHLNNVQLGRFGRNRSNLWSYAAGPGFGKASEEGHLTRLHPTPKPVSMIADAMLDTTQRGDLVLDFFLGSGTAVIAAQKIGRRTFGMEIDPVYVDVIVRRWQAWTGEVAIHAETGLAFEAIAAGRAGGADAAA